MQQCPSCLESFASDAFIVPHCGERGHGACRQCTRQWYQKQSNETCMVCRVGKSPDKNDTVLLSFGFGIMCSLLSVLILVLQNWVILLLKFYTYIMCYIYFKKTAGSIPVKEVFFVFFVGFNMTLYAFIFMFIFLSYSACERIVYIVHNLVKMVVNMHFVHFACSLYPNHWLSFLNLVNKVASVVIFCLHLFQINDNKVVTRIENVVL